MNRREKGQAKEEDDDDEDNENDDMEGPTDRVEFKSCRVTRASTIVSGAIDKPAALIQVCCHASVY